MKLAEIILKGPFQLFVDSYLSFEHCFYQYCAQKFARKCVRALLIRHTSW